VRLFRSFLFVPGNRERMLAKSLTTAADALLLDLEDAVPAAEREAALDMVAAFLPTARPRPVFVRINHPSDEHSEVEVRRLAALSVTGFFVPKVESAAEVQTVDRWITEVEAEAGLPAGEIVLVPVVESALGLLRAFESASAAPRVGSIGLASGENGDFQTDVGYDWSPQGHELLFARSKLVVDARAAGLPYPIDGVFADLDHEDDLITETTESKRLGFKGRMVIHPKQVDPVNRIYTPGSDEVAYYRRLLIAYDEAVAAGRGSANFEGKMIDYAMAERARSVIAVAESLA
jgi:citrate lyase subunit beta/citryl-CoA lyase